MDFKQLHNFCKVAETGSLTRAAGLLGLTQAALSRQLALLEGEMEVALFRRTGRGLVLTGAGTRLLEHARLILQQVAHARRSVKGAPEASRGTLALGLPPSLARTIVVPLVEAFQADIPEATLRAVDGLSADLMELVASGKLDCAVVYNTLATDKVELTPLAEESLYLVSGPLEPPHGLSLDKSVLLSDVARLPLIVAGQNNAIHVTLSRALGRIGKTPQVTHEIGNLTAILDLVRNGHGYSVIPLSGVHSCIDDSRLRIHRIRRPALHCSLFTALPAKSTDPLTLSELKLVRNVVTEQLKLFDSDVEDAIAR